MINLLQIARKKKDLKKKLRVSFEGEPGLDLGGLTKEWFLLLIRKIFREEYGMESRLYLLNVPKTITDNLHCQQFKLIFLSGQISSK